MAGYLTSFLYGKVRDRRNLPTLLIVAGMSVIALSEVLMELFGVSDVIIRNVLLNEGEYYAMHPACALGAFGIIAVEFALASWYLRWRDGRLPAFAAFVSRNIMRIYVAQWVVIGLLSPILFHVTNVELNALIGTGILAFCCFGTWLYTAHVKRSTEKERKA